MTEEIQNQIVKDYLAKVTNQELQRNYAISPYNLIKLLKDKGVYVKNNSVFISDEKLDFIKENYYKLSNLEISKVIGYESHTITIYAKKLGLTKKGSGHIPNEIVDNVDFNTDIFRYFLGWIASDGHITYKERIYYVVLSSTDLEIVERFNDYFNFGQVYSQNRGANLKTIYRYNISNKVFTQKIIELGLTPKKSYTLKVDESIIDSHFMRGVFEGDGHIRTRDFSVGFVSASIDFCNQIQKYLSDNDITSTLKQEGNCYRINFYGFEKVTKFYNLIYKDCGEFYLKRKKDIFETLFNNRQLKQI